MEAMRVRDVMTTEVTTYATTNSRLPTILCTLAESAICRCSRTTGDSWHWWSRTSRTALSRSSAICLSAAAVDADDGGVSLVNDRIHGYRRPAAFAITNNKFTLALPECQHRIDHGKAGLERLDYQITVDDAGCRPFDRLQLIHF